MSFLARCCCCCLSKSEALQRLLFVSSGLAAVETLPRLSTNSQWVHLARVCPCFDWGVVTLCFLRVAGECSTNSWIFFVMSTHMSDGRFPGWLRMSHGVTIAGDALQDVS